MGNFIWNPWRQALASLWPNSAATQKLAPLAERDRFALETSTQAHLGRKRESLRWSRVTDERFNSFEAVTPVPPQLLIATTLQWCKNSWSMQGRFSFMCSKEPLLLPFLSHGRDKGRWDECLAKRKNKSNIHLKYKLAWARTTRERGAANAAGRPLAMSMELAGLYEAMSKRWVPYSTNPALDINHMLHSFMYDWWRGKLQTRISEKEEAGSCISEVCRRWKRGPRERESLKSKEEPKKENWRWSL